MPNTVVPVAYSQISPAQRTRETFDVELAHYFLQRLQHVGSGGDEVLVP